MCNFEPIGFFDEIIKETLETAPGNVWFRDRRMLSECSDCPVLGVCRGGCRVTHHDKEINDVVCQIRKNIFGKLLSGYYTKISNSNVIVAVIMHVTHVENIVIVVLVLVVLQLLVKIDYIPS